MKDMICRAIPYEGKEPYIFVSYCHADSDRIYPLVEQMALDSYRLWYDDGNHGGDDWLENIENHLEASTAVVAFISENSSLSHNCKSEIIYALKCKKKVIPVLIEQAELPRGLRMQLSHLHYLKKADYPSDKALLNKLYEVGECAACKAAAGSVKLRDASASVGRKGNAATGGGSGFFANLFHVSSDPRSKTGKAAADQADTGSKASDAGTDVPEEGTHKKQTLSDEEKTVYGTGEKTVCGDGEKTVYGDGEKTIYGTGSKDGTVRMDPDEDDGEKTVRVSYRNFALLLQPAEQRAYTLNKPQTKLGRSPIRCDLVLEGNDSISKYHADIIQFRGKCFLRDANSANGTFLLGEQLEPGQQVELPNPAVFQLNDETLILVSGLMARNLIARKSVALLLNEACTAVRLLDADALPLNRNHKWSDGTLSDPKIHRAAHALVRREGDGICLVDESPEGGNGTYLNGSRLKRGDSRYLNSGDRIRIGDTTLEFVSITI